MTVNLYSIDRACQDTNADRSRPAWVGENLAVVPVAEPVEVIGLGVSGLSVIRYLLKAGLTPGVMDTRAAPDGLDELLRISSGLDLCFGKLDQRRLNAAKTIVVSPGVACDIAELQEAAANGAEIIGDIEVFARVAPAPVVAITGSNGKSTVTTMLRDMGLAAGRVVHAGGNLGPAALDLLELEVPDFYVLELSSFQLEITQSLKPIAAALLNLSEDHLDRYADMRAYVNAKMRIFNAAKHCITGPDIEVAAEVMASAGTASVQRICSGEPSAGAFGIRVIEGRRWLSDGHMTLMGADEMPVPGEHNELNALTALALGRAVELPWQPMFDALRAFRGLTHRCELVVLSDGVRWINDSKGTNVGATVAAVEGLAELGPIVLIAGGLGKGADFSLLGEAVVGRAKMVLLFGQDAQLIDAALPASVPRQFVADLQAAVHAAHAMSQAPDTVLLSPACASFDMFANFEQRGARFTELVQQVVTP